MSLAVRHGFTRRADFVLSDIVLKSGVLRIFFYLVVIL